MKREEKNERPEAYPKPTATDQQLKSQHEFLEPDANRTNEQMNVFNENLQQNERTRNVEEDMG